MISAGQRVPPPRNEETDEVAARLHAVLRFLFLLNAVVAVAAPFVVDGTQGVITAVGMGVVSLGAGAGAGAGLARGRGRKAGAAA
ncbi:hypothetical protein [Streptomyces sp. NPDC006739]|uniref:hypothetical protein n=1 Tax=Streptomyces sp. NPDC006739 TaxID=3364763 RepID=UPI0036BE84EB